MRIFFILIIILTSFLPILTYAGGGSNPSNKNIEKEIPSRERYEALLWKIITDDYQQLSGREISEILQSKALLDQPKLHSKNILHMDCGNGIISNYFLKENYNNIWAIDSNKNFIKKAVERYYGIHFQQTKLSEITHLFEDDFFSFIFSFNFFHKIPDKVITLQRLKEISKKGAILAIVDYYKKDKTYKKELFNLLGNRMQMIELDEFTNILQILDWQLLEKIDLTDRYLIWCNKILEIMHEEWRALEAKGYRKDDIKAVIRNINNMINAIETNKIGGTALIIKNI